MCEQETHILLASYLPPCPTDGDSSSRDHKIKIWIYSAYVYMYTDSCGSLLRSTLRCPFFLAMQLQYMISISSSPERCISSLCLQVPSAWVVWPVQAMTRLPATLGLSISKLGHATIKLFQTHQSMKPVRRGALWDPEVSWILRKVQWEGHHSIPLYNSERQEVLAPSGAGIRYCITSRSCIPVFSLVSASCFEFSKPLGLCECWGREPQNAQHENRKSSTCICTKPQQFQGTQHA